MVDDMILCDGCDLGYHLNCLVPPLTAIHEELYFCPTCVLATSQASRQELPVDMAGGGDSGAIVGQPEPNVHTAAVPVSVPKKRGRKSNKERAAARKAAEGS